MPVPDRSGKDNEQKTVVFPPSCQAGPGVFHCDVGSQNWKHPTEISASIDDDALDGSRR